MKPSRSEFLSIRGLRCHVRHWGNPGAPALFMMHGWMDVSASFQFVVDCLQRDWHVIAPDWRGFGLSENAGADSYWFPDYVGDLDAILKHYSPDDAVNLLGHSMGGNVVCIYAGVRPHRVRRLVNLEGFGMPPSRPEKAPLQYAKWLDDLQCEPSLSTYATQADVAARLQKKNPRLSDARAAFLSGHWAAQNQGGNWEVLGDPAHKNASPLLYHVDEVMACWSAVAAPVLWVEAAETDMWKWMPSRALARAEIDRRLAHFANFRAHTIADAGHMVHHDQPQVLAQLLEEFIE